ncbi:MAG TPA: glycosyltransferase family 39 protein [Anaerolineaceae bacterium]
MNRKTSTLLLILLLAVSAIVILRRAWISDDAYITFRTVDNLTQGYRLTWNITERVQAYTHPLWMFILAAVFQLTGELHFTTMILSTLLTLIVLFLLWRRLALGEQAAVLGILILLFSKSFVDYATSGLENPLSHLLLAGFWIFFFAFQPGKRNLFWLSLLASLGMLSRMDLGLVFVPALIFAWLRSNPKRSWSALLLGQTPFIMWEIFSILYYGFPFPNTAYAKLNTGIPQSEMLAQGLLYLLDALQFDPLAIVMIIAGIGTGFSSRDRRDWFLAMAVLLYVGYVVWVGGDFMSGRFLTIPLFLAVIALVRIDLSPVSSPVLGASYALIIILGLSVVNPTMRVSDFGEIDRGPVHVGSNGILDERMLYYGGTGLLNAQRETPLPTFYWAEWGEMARTEQQKVIDRDGIGLFSFAAGPQIYILDRLALADPLLARLPARRRIDWRPGHYERVIPEGYRQSLLLETNAIDDPQLKLYYEKIRIITRGSLFSWQRLVEIWKMNTGQYEYLINRDAFRYPGMKKFSSSKILKFLPDKAACSTSGVVDMVDSGLEIDLESLQTSKKVILGLDHNDRYQVEFWRDGKRIGSVNVGTARLPDSGGISRREILVPTNVYRQGYTALRILPLSGEAPYCLGYLSLE